MAVNNVRGVILAAGKSRRFKTQKCKLVFTVCGQPMVLFPVSALQSCGVPMTVVLRQIPEPPIWVEKQVLVPRIVDVFDRDGSDLEPDQNKFPAFMVNDQRQLAYKKL